MTEKELLKQLKNLKNSEKAGALKSERVDLMYKNLMARVENDLDYGITKTTKLRKTLEMVKIITNVFTPKLQLAGAFRYAMVVCIVLVIGMAGSLTAVSASFNSLPGDALYSIKLTTERIQLALAQDEAMKIQLRTEFAGKRIDEMKTIIESSLNNKEERMEKAISNFKTEFEGVAASLESVDRETATGTVKFIGQKIDELNDIIVRFAPELPENIKTAAEEMGGKFITLPASEDLDEAGPEVEPSVHYGAGADVNVEVLPTVSSSSPVYEAPIVPEIPEAPKKIQWQIIIEE